MFVTKLELFAPTLKMEGPIKTKSFPWYLYSFFLFLSLKKWYLLSLSHLSYLRVDIVIVGTRKRVKKLRDLADTVFKDVDDKTVGM